MSARADDPYVGEFDATTRSRHALRLTQQSAADDRAASGGLAPWQLLCLSAVVLGCVAAPPVLVLQSVAWLRPFAESQRVSHLHTRRTSSYRRRTAPTTTRI